MKNKKIRIGIDIDNVVLDFTGKFVECFEERTKIKLDRDEIDNWNIQDFINRKYNGKVSGNIFNEIHLEGVIVTDMNFKEKSKEALIEMHENKNIEIVFITALEEELAHIRKDWFKENLSNIIDYELHFETNKSKIKIDYLIDDGVHNLDELSQYIPFENCLCIKETYNKDCKYLKFSDLYNAYMYILNKEKLVEF